MTGAERGVLLLCCHLGDEQARPLTMARFRELSKRVQAIGSSGGNPLASLTADEVRRFGYSSEEATHIVWLLGRERQLDTYLAAAERQGIAAICRVSAGYPPVVAAKLGMSCPPVLLCRGDLSLLQTRCVAVVGSRALLEPGRRFAEQAGRLAAAEGYTLVSGGAEGADTVSQEACLQAGGSVIVFTAGRLLDCPVRSRCLYVSEESFESPFSVPRAMSRNRLIHVQGEKALVCQSACGTGGTWAGTVENLKHGWSPVFVCDDGTDGASGLIARGATPIRELESLTGLQPDQMKLT